MTDTLKMLDTYDGIPQDEAREKLDEARDSILAIDATLEAGKVSIGRTLNDIALNGLADAAYTDIGDRNIDNRSTAVSTFVKDELDGMVNRRKVSDWRKMARDFDKLEDAGVDTSGFAPSAFLALKSDASTEKFVEVVESVLEANDGKLTAKQFADAGRDAGIVNESRGSTAKPTLTGIAAKREPVLEPLNRLTVSAREAREAGLTFTKGQREQMAAVIADLTALIEA